MEPFLGINIYETSFDKEKGYSILKYGNMEVFIYQVERLESIYRELQKFLEVENTDCCLHVDMLEDAWLGSMWYGKSYQRAKKALVLSKEYFENCYSSRYIKHFYNNIDIEKFRDKWKHNVR